MAEHSNISWTDSTHNFWRGCTKVSPGCANCYAEKLVTTRLKGQWGEGSPRIRSKDFDAPLRWNKKPWVCDVCGEFYEDQLLCSCETLTGLHRRRVFSLSLGDWLDPEVPIEWLADMLDVVRRCDQLQWILCTKRPELFFQRMSAVKRHYQKTTDGVDPLNWLLAWTGIGEPLNGGANCAPPKNVCLLASVENQEMADKRIPELLKIPAAKRGLSCEPLLGPVIFDYSAGCATSDFSSKVLGKGIDWVIVGGESGPRARWCNIEWLRSIRDQCASANVPCFIKQLGSDPRHNTTGEFVGAISAKVKIQNSPLKLSHRSGADPSEWPSDLRIRQFPF